MNEALAALIGSIEASPVDPVSMAEDIDRHNELAMDEAKEKRILEEVAQCGSQSWRPDPSNGRKIIPYRISCKRWRRCPKCLVSRAAEFENRFDHCVEDTTIDGVSYLGIVQLDKDQAKEVVKKFNKMDTEYWRHPLESGGVLLFFDSLHFPDLDNPELHDSINWTDICQTPKGTRYSGNLGRREKVKKEGLVVKVPQFRFNEDLSEQVITAAWRIALKETEKLDPKYEVDAIEECLQLRMDCFEEAIESMKGEVVEKYRVMARVPKENFGWQNSDYEVPSTLETKEPPPGFVDEKRILFEKLKDEIWPIL